ncbi:hypothetical protein LJC17_04465 [Acholeplasma sp. OttesenSCG-928-E16]|nr:hypothetical protein [Acholeplasma sp. OttesenSCG-928-E16]
MTKVTIKNYFRYYKYFFILLGFISFGILMTALFFYLGIYRTLLKYDVELLNSIISFSGKSFNNMRADTFLSSSFFRELLLGILDLLKDTDFKLRLLLVVFIILTLANFIATREIGEWFCRFKLRKKYENENTLTGAKGIAIRMIASIITWSAYLIFTVLWSYSLFILPLFSALLNSFKEMFASYLVYNRRYQKKIIFKDRALLHVFGLQIASILAQYILIFVALTWVYLSYIVLFLLPILSYMSVMVHISVISFYQNKSNRGDYDKYLKKEFI